MAQGTLSLCSFCARSRLGVSAQESCYTLTSAPHNPQHAFIYDRANPAVRWPHLQSKVPGEASQQQQQQQESSERFQGGIKGQFTPKRVNEEEEKKQKKQIEEDGEDAKLNDSGSGGYSPIGHSDYYLLAGKERRKKMSRMALQKASDWRERVQRLTEAVCKLEVEKTVGGLLDRWEEQLSPTDYCMVVKQVGYTHWQRGLELFEWLNMKQWYTPNNRMLATILGVLGRANQVQLAEEIFQRAEPELGDCVQVFNAMLSVLARHGHWERMESLLKVMLLKGCERDLVTYNTLINGRAKAGLQPGMAMELLGQIWKATLRPDTVTYNTLISACSANRCYEDAVKIYEEMKEQGCQPDIWTYNAMISVYGRCGLDEHAEEVYKTMKLKGFVPDPITYNSILYALAKKGRVQDVEFILTQMKEAGLHADEITYNTMIHMYGKENMCRRALELYEEMKLSKRVPDTITFTVLIDGLGKAGLVKEAERILREMTFANVKPSLNTYSAMICAYAKTGMYAEAEIAFESMLKAGIQPDGLAFSVMLDVLLNAGLAIKVFSTYQSMKRRGLTPTLAQSGLMLRLYSVEGMTSELEALIEDMHEAGYDPASLCTTFAKAKLCDAAGRAFKVAVSSGISLDDSTVELLLSAYVKVERVKDARAIMNSMPSPDRETMREQLILVLADAERFEEASEELKELKCSGRTISGKVFRSLILSHELAGMPEQALQFFKEMQILGLAPDAVCLRSSSLAYCRVGEPDQGYVLLQKLMADYGGTNDATLHISLVKAYIKQQAWDKSDLVLLDLRRSGISISSKDYKVILLAYGKSAQFERVVNLVEEMMKVGLTPSSDCLNALLEVLLNAGTVAEVDDVYRRMDKLGVPADLQTGLIMLQAYAKDDNVMRAKGIYEELRRKGYVLPVQAFKVLIGLYSKVGCPEEAELTLKEMRESGYQPDTFVFNAMISVYSKVGSFKKAAQVFQGMKDVGFSPDTITYNTLIHVYSRRLLVKEAHDLLQQMQDAGCAPDLASYTMLLSAYGQLQMWEAATACFEELQELGISPDETTYNIMIDVYRRSGKSELSQCIVTLMKERGLQPSTATMSMLMDSYGKSGDTKGAEAVFDGMVKAGVDVNVVQYTSLIDSYLKEGDYEAAVGKLKKMQAEAVQPNYVTWTCVIAAASKCEERKDALRLLKALQETGFSLPLRLLTERGSSVLSDVEDLIQKLQDSGIGSGLGLLNVLQDLLWAFEKRASAACIYQLAVDKNIYGREFTRVEEGDWEADLCKLSPGAALVALNLWLIEMQEAALQGRPLSPKSVLLIVGSGKRSNRLSVSKSLKAHLWAMGSPFLVSKTRAGVLIAKGHSLRMWLKDSRQCMELELEDSPCPPELNSMRLHEEAWVPREMVPVFKHIEETMGTTLRPKKFMRLVNLEEEKRADVIAADIKGRMEKIARDKAKKKKGSLGQGLGIGLQTTNSRKPPSSQKV